LDAKNAQPRVLSVQHADCSAAGLCLVTVKTRKLCSCASPHGTLDAGTRVVCGDFHAMDVIGQGFQGLLQSHLFELVRSELCRLQQASDFVKGR
jgi:hypothetical protein